MGDEKRVNLGRWSVTAEDEDEDRHPRDIQGVPERCVEEDGDEWEIKCICCDDMFEDIETWAEHLNWSHNFAAQCNVCDELFDTPKERDEHIMQEHPLL